MSRIRRAGVALALSAITLIGLADYSAARPKSLVAFKDTYSSFYGDSQVMKCTVCHRKNTDRKTSNRYGDAVDKALAVKNVQDRDRIVEALRQVENQPSAIEGLTFGDLIRMGRLPSEGDE